MNFRPSGSGPGKNSLLSDWLGSTLLGSKMHRGPKESTLLVQAEIAGWLIHWILGWMD